MDGSRTLLSRRSALSVGIAAFASGLSGAVTPGPLLVGCVGEVARYGFVAALLLVAGHAVPEACIMWLVHRRQDAVRRARRARRAITALGVAALCLLGVLLLRDGLAPSTGLELTGDSSSNRGWAGPILAGLVLTVTNGYWWVWWATVGAALTAAASTRGRGALLAFFVGHESSDLVWYAIVGALVASGRGRVSPAFYRGLLISCGIAMFVMAAVFLVSLFRREPVEASG